MSAVQKHPAKIIGIQFSLLSPEEIERNSVAEITNKETYNGIKPKIGGLFDPRMGVLEPGLVCPTDGETYMNCPGYFGHIKLARPMFYIQYLEEITKILKCVCIKCSRLLIDKTAHRNLINYKASDRWQQVFTLASKVKRCGGDTVDGCECKQPTHIKKDGFATLIADWNDDKDQAEGITLKLVPETVLKIFKKISNEDIDFMGFSSKWSRPEWMICQVFAVPPPSIRPSVKHDAQQRSEDDLTHIIINIIKYNNLLKDQITKNASLKQIEDWSTVLQYYLSTIVDNNISGTDPVRQRSGRALKSISERHKGKTGRVRGNLMGKRVDYSARSVITPDPELSIMDLGVPLKIAMNLTKPVFVTDRNKEFLMYLVKNGPDVYPGAKILELSNGENISLRYHDRSNIQLQNGDTVHRHMMNGDYVLFNRQPTLHRMSMMAHRVKIMKKGDTFRMNVADTKPYNADFDGDEMNMHMPQNDEAEMELKHLAAIKYQIISPALNKSIIGIFQDSLLGSYLFTRENIRIPRKDAMNLLAKSGKFDPLFFADNKEEYTSHELVSSLLPQFTLHYKSAMFKEGRDDPKTSNYVVEIINGKMLRGQFEKDSLCGGGRGLIQRLHRDFSEDESQGFIDNLQSVITEYMKTTGFSVGMSDLISNEETNTLISEVIMKQKKEVATLISQAHLGILENKTGRPNSHYFENEVNNILNKASSESGKIAIDRLNKENRFVNIVKSGSKGTVLNISQMISCLGQQNVDSKRIPYSYPNRTLPHFKQFDDSPVARGFVESSFIQGLTPEELFFHAMGGRVGLIDTAVKTSQTGYIQRRLIKGMEDIVICYDRSVRNNKQKIIQFNYGGTNFDTTQIETSKFELIGKTQQELYDMYRYAYDAKEWKPYKAIFDQGALKRYKEQIADLKSRVKSEVHEQIETRNRFIRLVAENEGSYQTLYLPMSFPSLILNLKHQFHTQSTQTDMTPLECYQTLDHYYKHYLEAVYHPCIMFQRAFYYYLNPATLVLQHRFTKETLIFLLEKIMFVYKKATVNPGEMVGLISAQSIGEPTTQMNLNTFHFAGISTKSNVTRGVPRMEEILALTTNMKNPSMTIFLNEEDETDKDKAFDMISKVENTKFKNFVLSSEIYYDPDDMATLVEKDIELMKRYREFSEILDDCLDKEDTTPSRWILRLSLNKTAMIDSNLSLDEIHFALKSIYNEGIRCFYSDLDDHDVVFRIRLMSVNNKKAKPVSLDQGDQIYLLKSFQHNLLNNVVLRGVPDLDKVNLIQMQGYMKYNAETGDFERKDIYALDTLGTNLLDVLALDIIDPTRTITNNIMETYEVLGIEAARKCLFNEIMDVLCFDGGYVNHHHLALLCDRMTSNEKMVSIFRHGINNDDIGPIAKASFEETTEMFLKAARHGELDEMRGVSANVMCGQAGYYGTAAFSVYLNMFEVQRDAKESVYEAAQKDIFEELKEKRDEPCSLKNLKIRHTLPTEERQEVDNGYEMAF